MQSSDDVADVAVAVHDSGAVAMTTPVATGGGGGDDDSGGNKTTDALQPARGYASELRPPSANTTAAAAAATVHTQPSHTTTPPQHDTGSAADAAHAAAATPAAAASTPTHRAEAAVAAVVRRHGAVAATHDTFTTGAHYNALQLTLAEEYALHRHRCRASASFAGPLYVAEDVAVACAGCGGMVDPITRVPAGKLFFHPCCARCALCKRRGVAEAYVQVGLEALCVSCAQRGLAPCVAAEEVARRGFVLGALPRRRACAVWACDERTRRARAADLYVNLPTLPGATAPSLTLPGRLHTFRNTPRRTFALLHRQQYYTQNDGNVLVSAALVQRHGDADVDVRMHHHHNKGSMTSRRGSSSNNNNAACPPALPRLL